MSSNSPNLTLRILSQRRPQIWFYGPRPNWCCCTMRLESHCSCPGAYNRALSSPQGTARWGSTRVSRARGLRPHVCSSSSLFQGHQTQVLLEERVLWQVEEEVEGKEEGLKERVGLEWGWGTSDQKGRGKQHWWLWEHADGSDKNSISLGLLLISLITQGIDFSWAS